MVDFNRMVLGVMPHWEEMVIEAGEDGGFTVKLTKEIKIGEDNE